MSSIDLNSINQHVLGFGATAGVLGAAVAVATQWLKNAFAWTGTRVKIAAVILSFAAGMIIEIAPSPDGQNWKQFLLLLLYGVMLSLMIAAVAFGAHNVVRKPGSGDATLSTVLAALLQGAQGATSTTDPDSKPDTVATAAPVSEPEEVPTATVEPVAPVAVVSAPTPEPVAASVANTLPVAALPPIIVPTEAEMELKTL